MYVFAGVGSDGGGGGGDGSEAVLSAAGSQLRSTGGFTPPSTVRAVPVTVEDDLESDWTAKTNGGEGGSDIDSSSISSSVADPSTEYAHTLMTMDPDVWIPHRFSGSIPVAWWRALDLRWRGCRFDSRPSPLRSNLVQVIHTSVTEQ